MLSRMEWIPPRPPFSSGKSERVLRGVTYIAAGLLLLTGAIATLLI